MCTLSSKINLMCTHYKHYKDGCWPSASIWHWPSCSSPRARCVWLTASTAVLLPAPRSRGSCADQCSDDAAALPDQISSHCAASPAPGSSFSLSLYRAFYYWKTNLKLNVWKSSVVLPIYKGKGDPMKSGSYRGIKLLERAMKVVERIFEHRIW